MIRALLTCCLALGAVLSAEAQSSAALGALLPAAPNTVDASVLLVEHPQVRASEGLFPPSWRPRSARLNWIDYSLLAVTGAAAVLAIRYKFEADDLYEEYQQTGDPALRDRIRRLDRQSGVAVIGMQAGVVTFGARLLLR